MNYEQSTVTSYNDGVIATTPRPDIKVISTKWKLCKEHII